LFLLFYFANKIYRTQELWQTPKMRNYCSLWEGTRSLSTANKNNGSAERKVRFTQRTKRIFPEDYARNTPGQKGIYHSSVSRATRVIFYKEFYLVFSQQTNISFK